MDDVTRFGIDVPDLAGPDVRLGEIGALQPVSGVLADFDYSGAELRSLALADVGLVTGRVVGMVADRVEWERVDAAGVVWEGCRIGSFRWREAKLSRVVFRGCQLMAASFDALTLSHALFVGCRFDFANFDALRFNGPAAFVRCNLSEATFRRCNLSGVFFRGCELRKTVFDGGTYRRTDLRGNDLSPVQGGRYLRDVVISRSQQATLADALIAELSPNYETELGAEAATSDW